MTGYDRTLLSKREDYASKVLYKPFSPDELYNLINIKLKEYEK